MRNVILILLVFLTGCANSVCRDFTDAMTIYGGFNSQWQVREFTCHSIDPVEKDQIEYKKKIETKREMTF